MRTFGKLTVCFVSLLASTYLLADPIEISSPDTRIKLTLDNPEQVAMYSVAFNGVRVIDESRLGLEFDTLPNMGESVTLKEVSRDSHDEQWEQPWGERQQMREHYNEVVVALERTDSPAYVLNVRVRVFDDGLGIRYEMPAQQQLKNVNVVADWTEFRLSDRATTNALSIIGEHHDRYEQIYKWTPAEQVETAATPITFERADGIHISIHEAALEDWAGFTLVRRGMGGRALRVKMAPWSDGVAVKTTLPLKSSWRTLQIADSATGLLNSDLILNLNEPNVLGDVSWIHPGKYTGVWWEMHRQDYTWGSAKHGANNERVKARIDFAAKYGFDGVLVEGWNKGWDGNWLESGGVFSFTESYPDFDFDMLSKYGADKGVKIIGHHETSGNVVNYRDQMADAFDLYARQGVEQVKTGYVAWAQEIVRYDENGYLRLEWNESQYGVEEYLRSVKEAAKRKIAINTHEPVKDTGLRRKYPNWISREGARGMEYSSPMSSHPNPVDHDLNLVYTRMLSGPMDYTPGIFDLTYEAINTDSRVISTLAHQLALYVVLYSPIQMVPDYRKHYEKHMDAFQFILDVPTDWSQSIALSGDMKSHVVWARQARESKEWFVGAIAGKEATNVTVPLDFLESGQQYEAQIYRDGDTADWDTSPFDYVVERRDVVSSDSLSLRIAAGGGFAIRMLKK